MRCFVAQQHSRKELVVVYEDDDPATDEAVREFSAQNPGLLVPVRVPVQPKLTLGALRNLAAEAANGEYVCQWDDDDWYHVERISRQLSAIRASTRPACLLTNWLVFDECERIAYFSQFRLWEGSLLCRRDLISDEVRYPDAVKCEDTVFTRLLVGAGHVFPLVAPGLYIYTVHRKNTWAREHFEGIFAHSQILSPETSRQIEDILEEKHEIAAGSALLRDRRLLRQLNYFPKVGSHR